MIDKKKCEQIMDLIKERTGNNLENFTISDKLYMKSLSNEMYEEAKATYEAILFWKNLNIDEEMAIEKIKNKDNAIDLDDVTNKKIIK